jgi:multicomponent Na+:H+ antiporter subunit B
MRDLERSVILRTNAKFMVPLILLWGLYVLTHGTSGPGGGFQAGVVLAAGFILWAVVFGIGEMLKVIPFKAVLVIASLGVSIYAWIGVFAMVFGGNFLEYGRIPIAHEAAESAKLGIEMVEIGIGLTVMAIMLSIFYTFVQRSD